MCGIVGLARRSDAEPVGAELVRAMCDTIRHRGPDDEGVHVTGRAGIGMRRLSIIDLAGGHQPIFNEDRTKAIVFNGEIYNYRELRDDLVGRGHTFRTDSDTETIVHLYEEYGAACVSRLRGMFAFAIWDETARTLFLARDRFGIKPLYVAVDERQIAFASELKALTAIGLTRGLDWEGLEAFFRLGYVPAPHSPFTGVRKLEPGHVLTWHEGRWTDEEYWDLPRGVREAPADAAAFVLESIEESVEAHLVSDVPIAVLLSGGLDSSAVVASMAAAGQVPHAFTARYRGSGSARADETPLARLLADRYGARLTVVDIEPDVAGLIEPIVRTLDEPHADESSIPTWLISERVAQDYKVVLAGTGGDELFAGYRRHFGLLFSERYARLPAVVRSAIARAAAMVPEPAGGGLGVHRMKRFTSMDAGSSTPYRYLGLLNKLPRSDAGTLLHPDLARPFERSAALGRLVDAYAAAGSPDGVRAALHLDYRTYLPDDLLHLSDRISMAHSLEVRVPFVDHRLVERVLPLPERTRIGRGTPKHLLRQALRTRLPEEHFTAPKRGFVGPTAVWLRNELRGMVEDELSAARIQRLGYFDPAVVQGLIRDHMTQRHNRESVLWALLSFSVWHRLYCESPAAPAAQPARLARVAS